MLAENPRGSAGSTCSRLRVASALSRVLIPPDQEIKLLTKILASRYTVLDETRYLAVRRVGHV